MTAQPRIAVGVDGSRAAFQALLWAAAEAESRGASLSIVHAGDAQVPPLPDGDPLTDYARGLLADAVASVFENGIDCDVHTLIRNQPATEMLVEESRSADLVVVGSHGLDHSVATVLGSVAMRVAGHAECPVAVVDERWRLPAADDRSPVVVGVSMAPHGPRALEYAFAEAERRGVPLRAVRSWSRIEWSASAGRPLYATGLDYAAAHRAAVDTLLQPMREAHPGVAVETIVAGDPASAMLAEATEDASLLVLGCRHTDGGRWSRVGPTAHRLLHIASCPVVIVGHSAADRGTDAADARSGRALSSAL